ncbi:MAG: peptidoglycan DD-metalloendopeptidase family protein [Flavobacteriaceae bacterium]
MRGIWGALCILLLLGASCKDGDTDYAKNHLPEKELVKKGPILQYGFDFDEFNVVYDTVKRGDVFGELMLRNKVDYNKVLRVSETYRDTFDVRKIVVGKPYVILKTKDTSAMAQVFIYENDPVNYTVVDFRDSTTAYTQKKSVKHVQREVSGVIESSLSETMLDQGIDYNVTHNLADVYAWTVDFHHLVRGDRFKVVFEEKYINYSIYAGVGPIQAAYFEHNGESFYAFAFESDSTNTFTEYYDHKGDNLRRTFLKAPIKFNYRISSRYNLRRRIRYYGYKVRPHRGTDFAAPIGTPIIATASGTVTESTRRGGNGRYVKIRHNSTYSTQYLHMKKQAVRKGEHVNQGDVIGWVGMTGNTGGPHVCYRFWKNGHQVDPLREKLPKAEPIPEPYRESYFAHIGPMKEQLDCIEYPLVAPKEEIATMEFQE